MMDTQRLIALVVFSFSALLLWDAWQKHNAPKSLPVAASPATVGVPQPTTPLAPGATPAVPAAGAAAPAAPAGALPPPGGDPVIVSTDLFDVELNTLGGDIRRITMKQV